MRAILEGNGGRGLTVAFPFARKEEFIKARFVAYTQSALLYSGDESGFTTFGRNGVGHVPAGTPEYERLKTAKETKVNYSIYFVLAEWQPDGQIALVFPDGFGVYRIRTSSKKSVDNLYSGLDSILTISGGHFASVPFELCLANRPGRLKARRCHVNSV